MKKKIAALFTAAALCVSAVPANAFNFDELYDKDGISIIYNGDIISSDVLPKNVDGRVMVPFRAVLEEMGAEVDFEDETKTVTAKKDDVTIDFVLNDRTINIDNAGEKSVITMDTDMIIDNGRTLVPVRFMSEALGMEVGWDEYWECVLILDNEAYSEVFKERCPNITALSQIDRSEFNLESTEFAVKLNSPGFAYFVLSGKLNGLLSDNKQAVDINLDKALLVSLFTSTYDLEDIDISVISDGAAVYVKTNLFEKLAQYIPDEVMSSSPELWSITADTWLRLDINALLARFDVPQVQRDAIINALSDKKPADFSKLLMSYTDIDNMSVFDMHMLSSFTDVFAEVDKYIEISEDGKRVSIKITTDDIKSIIKAVTNEADADIDEIFGTFYFYAEANSEYSEDGIISDSKVNLAIDGATITIDISGTAKKDENAKAPEIPTDAVDILTFFSETI